MKYVIIFSTLILLPLPSVLRAQDVSKLVASAGNTALPYDSGQANPSFGSSLMNERIPGSYNSVQDVKFGEIVVNGVKLHRGSYDSRDDPSYSASVTGLAIQVASLFAVYYPAQNRERDQFAIAIYETYESSGIGGNPSGVALIFRLRKHRLTQTQSIQWDDRVEGDGLVADWNAKANSLAISVAHPLAGDSHAIGPSAIDLVNFRWDGNQLIAEKMRTERTRPATLEKGDP